MVGKPKSRRVGAVLAAVGVAGLLATATDAYVIDPCTSKGAGEEGWCGDGGPAVKARLARPGGVAATKDGGFLIADTDNNSVRRVSRSGTITRIAGVGLPGHRGDGGPAIYARLDAPTCVLEQAGGSILIHERDDIRRIKAGEISTVPGPDPCQMARLPNGDYLTPYQDTIVRTTPAGASTVDAGTPGYNKCGNGGDGGSAHDAQLARPGGVAALPDGGYLIADTYNNLVRRVSPAGIITTVAGRDAPNPPPCPYLAPPGEPPLEFTDSEYPPPTYVTLDRPLPHGKVGKKLRIGYDSGYATDVEFTLTLGKKTLRAHFKAPGKFSHVLLGPLKKKGTYKLKVRLYGKRKLDGVTQSFENVDRATIIVK